MIFGKIEDEMRAIGCGRGILVVEVRRRGELCGAIEAKRYDLTPVLKPGLCFATSAVNLGR